MSDQKQPDQQQKKSDDIFDDLLDKELSRPQSEDHSNEDDALTTGEPLSEGADVETLASTQEKPAEIRTPEPDDELPEASVTVENIPEETETDHQASQAFSQTSDQETANIANDPNGSAEGSSDSSPSSSHGIIPEDEIGISLSDEELWDGTGVEEIPLFEDQILKEELEAEENQAAPETPGQESAGGGAAEENRILDETSNDGAAEQSSADNMDSAADIEGKEASFEKGEEPPLRKEEKVSKIESDLTDAAATADGDSNIPEHRDLGENDNPPFNPGASAAEDGISIAAPAPSEAELPVVAFGFGIVPWIVTSLSTVLTIAAIITFGFMLNNTLQASERIGQEKNVASDTSPPSSTTPASNTIKTEQDSPRINKEATGTVDSLMLHPFLIPGRLGQEVVFYKLKIELVVPDATTKHALVKKEAWIRDIIYQQLKGMRIERSEKGDILKRYKSPLLKKLNQVLNPYNITIKDVRMSGYILK